MFLIKIQTMLIRTLSIVCLTLLYHGAFPKLAWSKANYLAGPVEAELVEVLDGDTIRVRAKIWLDQSISILVRLNGIDAPELRRPKCAAEKELAIQSRQYLASLLVRQSLQLRSIQGGKYFGRVVAIVQTDQSDNLSQDMLQSGLARLYKKGKRKSWCKPV
jgi:endonuclease YncB( thermonuclease family)